MLLPKIFWRIMYGNYEVKYTFNYRFSTFKQKQLCGKRKFFPKSLPPILRAEKNFRRASISGVIQWRIWNHSRNKKRADERKSSPALILFYQKENLWNRHDQEKIKCLGINHVRIHKGFKYEDANHDNSKGHQEIFCHGLSKLLLICWSSGQFHHRLLSKNQSIDSIVFTVTETPLRPLDFAMLNAMCVVPRRTCT